MIHNALLICSRNPEYKKKTLLLLSLNVEMSHKKKIRTPRSFFIHSFQYRNDLQHSRILSVLSCAALRFVVFRVVLCCVVCFVVMCFVVCNICVVVCCVLLFVIFVLCCVVLCNIMQCNAILCNVM